MDRPLRRTLGTPDAVVLGLGSMVGAGIFVAPAPAAAAAGSGLLLALVLAGAVAYANALSSARLAAVYPTSGGAYVYGRERLGEFWGYLAGWAFVVGKTASCAAMALAVGTYAWPEYATETGVAVVVALTAVNYVGVSRSAALTRVLVTVVVGALLVVVAVALGADAAQSDRLRPGGDTDLRGIAEAAGLLFFAFAGYARIATLGEEVRDPARTIRRAIPLALGLALALYAAVLAAALAVLGPDGLAATEAPLTDTVRAAGADGIVLVVRAAAVLGAAGALLALILGVSRTTLAMARDRHLPHVLSAVHPRFGVPHRAELAVGAVVVVLTLIGEIRDVVAFSSFGVLVYYAIANAAAWTLAPGRARIVPALGFVGCLALALTLPLEAARAGGAALAIGYALFILRGVLAR
ncbi:APC family permease [Sporichthya polymorpha]|uniref:APC family permease n=1 Tax=Sporichthya polymorpha TaxID=35751 RepID=UPI0003638BBA|nr:APC family permease [Sporichthya polymorpha]